MKIRGGFVSNSSSSSFIIVNTTKDKKRLKDFMEENKKLINKAIKDSQAEDYLEDGEDAYKVAEDEAYDVLPPDRPIHYSVGSDGDFEKVLGIILAQLGDGKSKSFKWYADGD